MTRQKRNGIIEIFAKTNEINSNEKITMIHISSVVGDSSEIPIDWDDLSESTGIDDYSIIENYLDTMYDLDILEILDYESDLIG